ncbi:MAG: hypothetical protein K9J81_11710 [Desulfohalobiaceae bacterium]|nr:hypothetical protein [Desulfohalobiaceae bacterium]
MGLFGQKPFMPALPLAKLTPPATQRFFRFTSVLEIRNLKFDEPSENTLHFCIFFLANFPLAAAKFLSEAGQFPISNYFDKDFNCFGATHFLLFCDRDEPISHQSWLRPQPKGSRFTVHRSRLRKRRELFE